MQYSPMGIRMAQIVGNDLPSVPKGGSGKGSRIAVQLYANEETISRVFYSGPDLKKG